MKIVDLIEKYLSFVSHCTHQDDDDNEQKTAAKIREKWIKDSLKKGLKIKVAIDKSGTPLGFVHCLPIEMGTWGMRGKDFGFHFK